MSTPRHILVAALGFALTFNRLVLAQAQPSERQPQSDLSLRLQQVERRIEGLETRQSETALLLKTLLKKLEPPDDSPDESSRKSEGLRLLGTGVPPTPTADDRWRYKFHQGRWWYLRPNDEWLYWSDDHWVPLRPLSPAAAKVVEGQHGAQQEEQLSTRPVTAEQVGASAADNGNLPETLRKVAEALGRLEKQVQRQAAAQALLVRGQTVLIDGYRAQADQAARDAEARERKREQNQKDLAGVE